MINIDKIPSTNENLYKFGLEPAARLLIEAAQSGSTVTYGETKALLERRYNLTKIFDTRIGYVAGGLMHKLQQVEPDCPLLNVLMVRQSAPYLPGAGAGSFLAARFGERRLEADKAPTRYPKLWEEYCNKAADEVYAYPDWEKLYKKAFNKTFDPPSTANGEERDGHQFGGGGEGENHKSLRLWVLKNPAKIRAFFVGGNAETEVLLESADRIDVVYSKGNKKLAIEVKSKDSNEADLKRGLYQCIKYQAVLKAQDLRRDADIKALLVCEQDLVGDLLAVAKRLRVPYLVAPKNRGRG